MSVRKLRNIFIILFIFLFVGTASFGFTIKQALAETSIAVVDVDRIMVSSKAAKSVIKQFNEERENFVNSVKKQEDALRTEQKAIEKKRADMSEKELLKKAQEFEIRRIETRNDLQKKKAALDKSYSATMNKLTKTITEVCQKIANDRQIDLVVTRHNIIVGSNKLDITSDVMKLMDKKLPSLSLE